MDAALALLVSMVVGLGYFAGSARVIEQGNQALVERLGRYKRTLLPGLNFVVPLLDTLIVETTRERTKDIQKQRVITRDELAIEVDAAVNWRIVDLHKAYYEIENIEEALDNVVLSEIRAQFGQIDLAQTFSQIETLNQVLLEKLDAVTQTWGVKILRVVIQEVSRPEELDRAMERTRIAESEREALRTRAEGEREAAIAEAEGRKRAAIAEAEGIVQSMKLISAAMNDGENSHKALKQIVQYLMTQRYMDATQKVSESNNSKVIFMDPKTLTETINGLMEDEDVPSRHDHSRLHGNLDFATGSGPSPE